MKTVSVIIGLIVSWSALAQETPLLKLEEPIKGFNHGGTLSIYAKSGMGPNISSFPPRIEMVEGPDGVIVRGDFHIGKYDFEGRKKWEVSIEKEFGLQAQPYMKILTDEVSTYIIELQTQLEGSERVRITHISADGVKKEHVFLSDLNKFVIDPKTNPMVVVPFLFKGELRILAESKDIADSDKKPSYRLYTMDLKSSKLVSKDIELPVDKDDEHSWGIAGRSGDNLILTKSYVKKTKKQKDAVTQVLEMDPDGKVVNHRTLDFHPSEVVDREFVVPSLFWNAEDKTIIAAGMMEIDKNKLNGLYLIKYDLATGKPLYREEHSFDKILKPEIKTNVKSHYSIPEQISNTYSLRLSESDVLITPKANTFEVRIITGFNSSHMDFFQVKFDSKGQHIQTGIVQYGAALMYYRNVVPQPEEYQLIWKDNQAMSPSPWDAMNKLVSTENNERNYFVPLTKANKLVKYDQKTGAFSLVSVK